jgi:hypothetical protein
MLDLRLKGLKLFARAWLVRKPWLVTLKSRHGF